MAEKNPKSDNNNDTEMLMSSVSKVFGSDYERYKKDLYISVQLYAARGFLRDDEAKKLETVIDAIFESNNLVVMLPYNTKLTEEGKEVLAGQVTATSAKWIERRIEWIKREIEQEYAKGFPRITKELRQIKMEDFFQLDEAINKQEELLEQIRTQPKGQKQPNEQYLSKKSKVKRDSLKQAEAEIIENLFKLNAFRDEYEKDWYAELMADQAAFIKKVEARKNMNYERYDIDSELSAFYKKTESANEAMKRAINAQNNLNELHKQMDKVYENLNNARKILQATTKNPNITPDDIVTQKNSTFNPFQNLFSNKQQKAEKTLKKALNDSKTLQKAIDTAQIEYETAKDTWKTIVYGASQKTQTDNHHPT